MDTASLYEKLIMLPDDLKQEVSDFIDFLSSKTHEQTPEGKPQFGSGKNLFEIKPGFDEPLQDFKEYVH